MKNLAAYLIENEENVDKKVQFFLDIKNYEKALSSAIKGGDTIIINHLFTKLISWFEES